MTIGQQQLSDYQGRTVIICASCGNPVTTDDLFELGLRIPDDGESQDDYFSAELIDDLQHQRCARERHAG